MSEKIKLERISLEICNISSNKYIENQYITGDAQEWTYQYTWEDFEVAMEVYYSPNSELIILSNKIKDYFIDNPERLLINGRCTEFIDKTIDYDYLISTIKHMIYQSIVMPKEHYIYYPDETNIQEGKLNRISIDSCKYSGNEYLGDCYTTGDDQYWTYEWTWEDYEVSKSYFSAKVHPLEAIIQNYFIEHPEKLLLGGYFKEKGYSAEEIYESLTETGKFSNLEVFIPFTSEKSSEEIEKETNPKKLKKSKNKILSAPEKGTLMYALMHNDWT